MGRDVVLVSSADETAFAGAAELAGPAASTATAGDGRRRRPRTASSRPVTSTRSASSAAGCSGPSSTTARGRSDVAPDRSPSSGARQLPRPGGACSGYLVQRRRGRTWSLDLGPGTLGQPAAATSPRPTLDAVVLTHRHPDHWLDLAGLRRRPAVRPRASRACRCYGTAETRAAGRGAGRGAEPHVRLARRRRRLARSRSAGCASRFARTDHYVETLAVRVDDAASGASLGLLGRHRPGWSFRRSGDGIDLALCEATTWPTRRARAVLHLSARQAGVMARAAGVPTPGAHPPLARAAIPRPTAARGVPRRSAPRSRSPSPNERYDPVRHDGREPDELRADHLRARLHRRRPPARCSSPSGDTMVLCTASIDDDVPRWMRGSGKGWVTAEYSMLPGSSDERIRREVRRAAPAAAPRRSSGSSAARCAPCATWSLLGERQVIVDCDVLQADGGTRTASISGGYVALHDALTRLVQRGRASRRTRSPRPARRCRSASSAACRCSTCPTSRTPRAEVDMNVVMTESGRFVEVQGTAEGMAVHPGRARRAARAGRGGHRRDRRPAGRAAGRRRPTPRPERDAGCVARLRLVLRHGQPRQGGRDRRDPRRRRRAAAPPGRRARRRRGRATRSRATPGSRPSPSPRPPGWPAVADDTGLEVDALGGAPGRVLGPLRGRGRDRRRQRGQAAARARPRRSPSGATARARFRTVALVRCPDGREVVAEGRRRGHDRRRAAGAPAASATTRCSSPTDGRRAAPSPR